MAVMRGWFKESYRHRLAAQGVKTNYYAGKKVDLISAINTGMILPKGNRGYGAGANKTERWENIYGDFEESTNLPAVASDVPMPQRMYRKPDVILNRVGASRYIAQALHPSGAHNDVDERESIVADIAQSEEMLGSGRLSEEQADAAKGYLDAKRAQLQSLDIKDPRYAEFGVRRSVMPEILAEFVGTGAAQKYDADVGVTKGFYAKREPSISDSKSYDRVASVKTGEGVLGPEGPGQFIKVPHTLLDRDARVAHLKNEERKIVGALTEFSSESDDAGDEAFRDHFQEKLKKVRKELSEIDDDFYARKGWPMKSVETREIPEGEWTMERKWDGSRALVEKNGTVLRITNRRGAKKMQNFPELQHLKGDIREDAEIDGELVVRHGKDESFKDLSSREHSKSGERIHEGMMRLPAKVMAFDIIKLKGKDVSKRPIEERRKLLASVLKSDRHIEKVKVLSPTKQNIAKLKGEGAEGVIFKRKGSAYVGGRSADWQKMKFKKTRDVIVAGYEEGTGKRKGLIGAIRIADAGGRSLGKVGTGFSDAENARLKRMLDRGRKPVVRVEYLKAGTRGALREPVYVGLRSDIKKSEAN